MTQDQSPRAGDGNSNAEILDALQDILAGWKYIRSFHGDLYGVGWDRAQAKAEAAIAKLAAAPAAAPAKLSEDLAKALRPLPFSNAEIDRLYANIPPTAQQDARSREAFRRLVRVVEAGHGIQASATVAASEGDANG